MADTEIAALEQQIYELTIRLNQLRKAEAGTEIPDYTFSTLTGDASLLDLFAGRDTLLLIHNMGQGCRYCTLWGDGFNGFLPHLESAMSVVLVSGDDPALQRRFANSRGWRFRLASHGKGDYIREQSVLEGADNMPGAVVYTREGSTIRRKNAVVFGPGDRFCSAWNLLALAGLDEAGWTPQFNYWQRPAQLDDGGANLID
jgi:predicted dithiol-disulfide oxidoreductase (DUF899 family)